MLVSPYMGLLLVNREILRKCGIYNPIILEDIKQVSYAGGDRLAGHI